MSGETGAALSGWTTDTLRELVITLNRAQDEHRAALRGELDRRAGELAEAHSRSMTDLLLLLNERYATQTKALDAAFKAAEQAVATALASQEKAVGKAEAAADKRFDAVNEFRAQLADQAGTFLTRVEYDGAHQALIDKFESATTRNATSIRELELRLTSRLDLMAGGDAGVESSRNEARQVARGAVAIIGTVLAAAAIMVTIIIATRH